jgi:hypothetical protein
MSHFYFNSYFYACEVICFKGQSTPFEGQRGALFQLNYCYSQTCMRMALQPRCLEQCVSLYINYCAFVYFLCGFRNPKNHFHLISSVQNIQCTFKRFVVVLLYCFIKCKSLFCIPTVGRVPCCRNGVDRFVIGKIFPIHFNGLAIRILIL